MRAGRKRSAGRPSIRLRYTKAALLIFGLGLVTGLFVVVGEFSEWEYFASGIMALGLVLLPLGLFADGRGIAALRWIARRFSGSKQSPKRGRAGAHAGRLAVADAQAQVPAARRVVPRAAPCPQLEPDRLSLNFRLVIPGRGVACRPGIPEHRPRIH